METLLSFDWSQAPQDATHYTECRNGFYPMWWKQEGDVVFVSVMTHRAGPWKVSDTPIPEWALSVVDAARLIA